MKLPLSHARLDFPYGFSLGVMLFLPLCAVAARAQGQAVPQMVLQLGNPFPTDSDLDAWADHAPVLAAVGGQGVQLWDTRTWELKRTISLDVTNTLIAQLGPVVALTPDGATLAVIGDGGRVRLWDTRSGALKLALSDVGVTTVAFSPDGRNLVASKGIYQNGSGDKTTLWDAATGRVLLRLPFGGNAAFTHDSRRLAIAARGQVTLWDIAIGRQVRTLTDASGALLGPLAFSPDGRLLATVAEEPHQAPYQTNPGDLDVDTQLLTVKVWDTRTGKRLRVLRGQRASGAQQLRFSADGRHLVSAGDDGDKAWDTRTYHLRHLTDGASLLTPDGGSVVSEASGGVLTISARTGRRRLRPQRFFTLVPVSALAWAPDGARLAVQDANPNGALRLWDPRTGRVRWSGQHFAGDSEYLHFSKAGRLLSTPVSLTASPTAAQIEGRIYKFATLPHPRQQRPTEWEDPSSARASPDGSRVAVIARSIGLVQYNLVRIRNLHGGGPEVMFSTPDTFALSLAWSPGGKTLAVRTGTIQKQEDRNGPGVLRGTVQLRDADTGRLRQTLALGSGQHGTGAVTFSSDGRRLAASLAQNIAVYDLTTDKPLWATSLPPAAGDTEALALSPDGTRLIRGGDDGMTYLWRVADGRLTATLLGLSNGDTFTPDWIALTPDGYYLASPGAAAAIRWRVGDRLYPASHFASRFRRPALVRQALLKP